MSEQDFPPEEAAGRLEVPESITLKNFWQSVATGKWHPTGREEIEKILDKEFFSHKPLTPLTKKEKAVSKKHLVERVSFMVNHDKYEELATGPVVYIPSSEIPKDEKYREFNSFYYLKKKGIFVAGEGATEFAKTGDSLLTKKQKMELFSDPDIWTNSRVKRRGTEDSALGIGTRLFFSEEYDEGYNLYNKDGFEDLVDRIKRKTGKEELKILDIGGSNGLAMTEVKEMYPDLETFNLTIHEAPALWPVDHFLFSPAERMDAKYNETFDIIVSNVAWRYFVYPDIALRNAVKSLSVGGEMAISFGWDRCPLDFEELEERLEKVWTDLRKLDKGGVIEFNESRVSKLSSNENIPYLGRLFVKKLKSLTEEDL